MSAIEWTDRTWNPVTGCTKISAGCDRCYAATFAERWRGTPGHPYEQGFDLTLRPERLLAPLSWRRPSRIFVNSMSDLLHDGVPDEFVARVFAVMALTRRHTFQVLTKRHARLRSLLGRPGFRQEVAEHATDLIGSRGWQRWQLDLGGQRLAGDSGHGAGWTTVVGPAGSLWLPPWPLPNVWLGVSAEDQRWAAIRVPALLGTPAAVRWVSAEPLLGPIELGRCDTDALVDGGIDWVVVGGESGHGSRPMDLTWADDLVHECERAGVPVFVKQLGTVWARQHGGPVKGGDPRHWPASLRVRQFPRSVLLVRDEAYELLAGAEVPA